MQHATERGATGRNQQNLQQRTRPVIRLFVSSTFGDMKHERSALQADVFPKLEALCLKSGFQFQAIDLRWGVPAEAGLDHRTMRICFEELRRAQQISPQPNFLILLGDRYGWQPLPEELNSDEFHTLELAAEQLAKQLAGTDNNPYTTILRDWYRQDTNALTPIYVLQSRRQRLPDDKEGAHWKVMQEILWKIINHAYPLDKLALRFNVNGHSPTELPPRIVHFQASATEQEIWAGALGVPDASEHVLAFFREIKQLKECAEPKRIKSFVDFNETTEQIDTRLWEEQNRLKDALRIRLNRVSILECKANLVPAQNLADTPEWNITTDHLPSLCEHIESHLTQIIKRQIEEYWAETPPASLERTLRELTIEQEEHRRFASERGGEETFIGREAELEAIRSYLADDAPWPLVFLGASGAGKTALLARASQVFAEPYHPVVRFIGATPDSSDIYLLLGSLCRQLRLRYPRDEALPTDLMALTQELRAHFAAATVEKPLVLVLDALDQLSDPGDGSLLQWIPAGRLPDHVKLIVSCLSELQDTNPSNRPLAVLKSRSLPQDRFHNLDVLTEGEAWALLLERWLPRAGRQVTAKQQATIGQRLTSKACRQPIYLKLLFEKVRLWRSYDATPVLGEDVPTLLDNLFESLRLDHGELLVDRVLVYLTASRWGLAENEILELLFADPEYRQELDAANAKYGHRLPTASTRIPTAIWSRLRFDLNHYLVERTAPGSNVLNFYHREITAWIREHLVKQIAQMWNPHERLASYFRRTADPGGRDEWNGEMARALRELPFHTFASDNQAGGVALLTSLSYLSARVATGDAYQLAEDYALTTGLPEFLEWREFIRRHAQRLTDHPKMLVALVQHEGFPSAQQQVLSRAWRHSWLRSWEEPSPPGRSTPSGLRLDVEVDRQFRHGRVGAVAWHARLIFAVERLGVISIVDYRDMQELFTRVQIGKGRPVTVACAPDASSLLVIMEPGTAELHRCVLGADGRPLTSEVVARFDCSLPDSYDPVVEWHEGAYWMQIRSGMLARVDAATGNIREEPLCGKAPGDLGALLFLDGERRFVAVRQGHSTILGGTGGVAFRRVASQLCTACACGDHAVAFFADGHAAMFDVTEAPVEMVSIRTGIVCGAPGWDGKRLLWLKEMPPRASLHCWCPGDNEARSVEGGLKVFVAGLQIVPRAWGNDGAGATLVLTTHRVVRFHVEEGGAMREGRLVSLFGGVGWRAVRNEGQTIWLWDGQTGREVCLRTDDPGRLYCALDGRGLFYAAGVDGSGVILDLSDFETTPFDYQPLSLHMAVGDPEQGCWFSDRKGGIFYAGASPEMRLAATVEAGIGAGLHVCGDYLLWRGTIPHFYPDMGVDQARAFVFFRRGPGTDSPLEHIGERLFAVREGLCIALDYDHVRGKLVLLWQPEGQYPILRTATIEDFLADQFLDRELRGLGFLGDSRIAVSPDGSTLGIINSAKALVCVSMETGELAAELAGSLPFTHISPGGEGTSFWLVQAQDLVYGCTLEEPQNV